MNTSPKGPSRTEKVGDSLGDIATNFFFMSMILYQTRFYTDTVGLSAVAVGSLFLLVRGAHAFSISSSFRGNRCRAALNPPPIRSTTTNPPTCTTSPGRRAGSDARDFLRQLDRDRGRGFAGMDGQLLLRMAAARLD